MTEAPPAVPPSKKRRGRETALDMVRTLAVVFALVIPLWFFGQASPKDSKTIRPVDPTETYRDFRSVTGGPVPATPAGWTPNVQAYEGEVARVGYVKGKHYMEWQASTGTEWVYDATGRGKQTGSTDVGGVSWQTWSDGSGNLSLVRSFGKVTELVGGVRQTGSLSDLKVLAATIR